MSTFEFFYNVFKEYESSKRNSIFLVCLSAIYPALTFIIFHDHQLFIDNSLPKLIVLSLIINIEMLFTLIMINFLPVLLINFLQKILRNLNDKFLKSLFKEHKVEFDIDDDHSSLQLMSENGYSEMHKFYIKYDEFSSSNFSKYTTPFLFLCFMYVVIITFAVTFPEPFGFTGAFEFFGKFNRFSSYITIGFLGSYLSYSIGLFIGVRTRIKEFSKEIQTEKLLANKTTPIKAN